MEHDIAENSSASEGEKDIEQLRGELRFLVFRSHNLPEERQHKEDWNTWEGDDQDT